LLRETTTYDNKLFNSQHEGAGAKAEQGQGFLFSYSYIIHV